MWKYVEKNDAWGREVWASDALSRLYLMPASGSQLYYYYKGWHCAYKESLNLREKVEIYNLFYEACAKVGILPSTKSHGEIAEDRDSQITFSFFGQLAPLTIKKPWDPDQQKRLKVAMAMKEILKDKYEVTVGGASSIDVTLKGRDKAYGMSKFIDYEYQPFKYKMNKDDVLFIADALFVGGNDHSVISTGVECISVKGPEETEKAIKSILGE